jgi:hypothetical protein
MYAVSLIYRGALRRRIRRLVRSRVFNNARTATRNLDLPLAIGDPIATHNAVQNASFSPGQRTKAAVPCLPSNSEPSQDVAQNCNVSMLIFAIALLQTDQNRPGGLTDAFSGFAG